MVMESIYRLSDRKMDAWSTRSRWSKPLHAVIKDQLVKRAVNCGYLKAADIAEELRRHCRSIRASTR